MFAEFHHFFPFLRFLQFLHFLRNFLQKSVNFFYAFMDITACRKVYDIFCGQVFLRKSVKVRCLFWILPLAEKTVLHCCARKYERTFKYWTCPNNGKLNCRFLSTFFLFPAKGRKPGNWANVCKTFYVRNLRIFVIG